MFLNTKTLICTLKHVHTPTHTPRKVRNTTHDRLVTIHYDKCNFGLFWPIFGWIWPFPRALAGCKIVILNSKTLICALKYFQTPTNTPRRVTTTTHDRPVTLYYDKCNVGLFWPILGYIWPFSRALTGCKIVILSSENSHLCS